MDWIHLIQDRKQWRALVNTTVNLGIYEKQEICWVSRRLLASQQGFCSVEFVKAYHSERGVQIVYIPKPLNHWDRKMLILFWRFLLCLPFVTHWFPVQDSHAVCNSNEFRVREHSRLCVNTSKIRHCRTVVKANNHDYYSTNWKHSHSSFTYFRV
jgi:hypothetical protein